MNVTGPIKDLIAADSTANGLLSGRVYAGVLPQNATYPAAVLNVITTTPTNTKTQASDLDFVRLQIDVYGSQLSSVANTASAIRGAIDFRATGSIKHIEYLTGQDGFSEKPELFRWIDEYTISLKR